VKIDWYKELPVSTTRDNNRFTYKKLKELNNCLLKYETYLSIYDVV